MVSTLIITSVEKLQSEIDKTIKSLGKLVGIYVSLNKSQKSIESILNKNRISTKKLFFIDCVSNEKTREDVLHISPRELDKLSYAIRAFIKDIKDEKFIILDALSTLLIYNDENSVAEFVQKITEYANENEANLIALSPSTKGEELLNKIFNFFDEVKKPKDEKIKKTENKEELIY